jgi:hypothetical protein
VFWLAIGWTTMTIASVSFATTSPSCAPKAWCNASVARAAITLTPLGARLGVLIVKLRIRLLGPLVTLVTQPCVGRPPLNNPVDAALQHVDSALDQLCAALGLQPAA